MTIARIRIASIGVFALLLVIANRAAFSQGGFHKIVAAPGIIDEKRPGVQVVADYGTYRLYRIADDALAALRSSDRKSVTVRDDMDVIQLDAYRLDARSPVVNIPPSLTATDSPGRALHLVQFVGPVKQQWLDRLEHDGIRAVQYIESNAYLVFADAAGRKVLDQLATQGAVVQYSGPYHPYYKLGPTLRDPVSKAAGPDRLVPVTIQILDHDGSTATEKRIASAASSIDSDWEHVLTYRNIKATLPLSRVAEIAGLPDVTWIGERLPITRNDEKQGQLVAGHLNGPRTGPSAPGYKAFLDSKGFSTDPNAYPIVGLSDDGVGNGTTTNGAGDPTFTRLGDGTTTRLAFVQNCTANPLPDGLDGHGHINTSIVGGYDVRSGDPYRDADGYQRGMGMNPYGRMGMTKIFANGGSYDTSNCGGTDAGVIASSYGSGARISSNSWGCSGCASSYDASSQAYDAGTRDALPGTAGNQEYLFVFAAGNSGSGAATVGTPGNGKNMITAAASENDRATWTDGCAVDPTGADNAMDIIGFSSRGPSPGGRTKPEITAPGTHIQGTASTDPGYNGTGVCDQYEPTGQTVFAASSGTSHSTPSIAGTASLYYRWLQDHHLAAVPSPALIKAYMLTHTTYLTGVGANDTLPSNSQGYGMPNLEMAFDSTPRYLADQSVRFDASGDTWVFHGSVADPSKPVRIVMVYTDAPGAVGTSPQVNNLDLQAVVGGSTYNGNVFSGQYSVTGGSPDTANNFEAVFLPAGTTGAITINVNAFNIAGDGVPNTGDATDQDFALVCYNCATCAGSISTDRPSYTCNAAINITLGDSDLTGLGTHVVTIRSTTEATPENVTLIESPANSGVFVGSFPTTAAAPVHGDGHISVVTGDTVTLSYLDVSSCGTPNVTVEQTAAIDCQAPIISNVQITNITGNSADVTFTTNEPTDAIAQYGTTPPPSGTASNPTLTTAHTVHLANLTGCTAYVVAVQATDPTGNTASDNNGNAYYGFITLSNVTPTYAYTGPPVAIPDSTTVTATIAVPDVKLVQDVNVKVANLTHTYDGDLVLTLIAPNGVRVQLANKRGSGGDNYTNTVFDDEATTPIASGTPPFTGSFQPEVPLSAVDNIPANGNWTLEVQDTASGDTGTLTAWELQFTYPSEPCPTVGSVTLDKDVYRCSDSAQIHVVDFSIVGAGTQPVTIVSTTEGSGETVTLNETPANSGSFIGTIALTTAAPSTGDSLLSVANNDTITVTYIDADDGYGHLNVPRTDTATLDCAAPVITNVQAQNIIADQADITFTTDQPGNTTVYYGTTLPPTTPLSAAAFVTSHSTHLTGLAACTPYFYYVVSADPVGNSSTANNGGAYYSFTSDCTGPVITNIHTANFVGSSIDIDFDTNEPGNTTVYFGTTAPPTTPFTNAAFVTSHVTNVTGLAGCTQYFFYVVSADPVGNSTTDNNGGAYYSFSTDCTPPVITNVHTANLNGNSVDIVFDTNEPGNTTVFYGTTAPPATQASSAAFVTAHSLHVTGLTPCTAYYYYVTSADPLGNSATNNNNGVYYAFTTPVNNNPTYSYSGPPVAIPDNSPTGASVTINVTDVQQIVDLNVRVNITHTFDGDLTLSLTGPDSTTIILSNRRGSSGDNFTDTVFDQEAATAIASGTAPFTGSFIPDESLAGYAGKFATGTWTLKVVDSAAADTGSITGFDLFFTYPPQPCGQPVVHRRSHTVANACSVGGPGNGDAYADPGEALTIPVELLNTGTGAATGVVATLSSTNPNVTFTQASANYGNLAIAQSAFGSQPFVAQVGSNVACGTVIPILITTVSNEGSWTDTISVQVGAPVFNSNTYTSTDVPKTISDNTIVTSNLTIANTGVIGDLNVQVSITHTWDGDLTLTLIGPNAQRVTLVNRRGSSGDNFTGTIFDDQAATAITAGTPPYTGSFRPEQPLSVFNGMAANGTWKLEVNDQAAGDTGTLTAWSIQVTTPGTYACNVCTLAAPGEATQLQFTAPDTVSWSSAPGASYYYLYRGVGSALPNLLNGTVDSCQRAGTASLSMTSVGDTPAPSQLLWYLVRGWNTGGLGTPGNATAGPRVQDSSGTCP